MFHSTTKTSLPLENHLLNAVFTLFKHPPPAYLSPSTLKKAISNLTAAKAAEQTKSKKGEDFG